MTLRAVILGLLGAVFIGVVGYLNMHMETSSLTRGHFPISVFGLLILVAAFVNPLLFRIGRNLRFRPAELAFIVAMALVACNVPSAGLMRYFTGAMASPLQQNKTNQTWKKTHILRDYTPPALLVNDGQYDEKAIGNYIAGMGTRDRFISFGDVPWEAWRRPLTAWLFLIACCSLAVICISLIVHPQWSRRERLKYPIADFAISLLEEDPQRPAGPIFRNKAFWGAMAAILAIHLVNGSYLYLEGKTVQIPLAFDFKEVFLNKFPKYMATPRAAILTRFEIMPAVVGFSFFLASDISFSLGITHFLTVTAMYLLMQSTSLDVSGSYMGGGVLQWHNFGSFLGLGLLLAYLGRRYYGNVVREALLYSPRGPAKPLGVWLARAGVLAAAAGAAWALHHALKPYAAWWSWPLAVLIVYAAMMVFLAGNRHRETELYSIWAFRVLLAVMGGMIVWLIYFGLSWVLAVLAVVVLLLMFLVIARINAESGLFFYKPPWMMPAILVGFFGMETFSPQTLVILGMAAVVLSADPFECLIPYVTNALKISDGVGLKPGRVGLSAAVVFLIVLAVVVPVVLWADYNYGMTKQGWLNWATRLPFDAGAKAVDNLTRTGKLGEINAYGAWEQMKNFRPEPGFFWATGLGLALVLLVGKLRLRFPWWPLHPVVFLGFGAWIIGQFGFSFLLGCFLKTALTKLGGQQRYRQARPLMVGMIAGDLLGGLLMIGVNWLYYGLTGVVGKDYKLW